MPSSLPYDYWQEQAACKNADIDLFFPDDPDPNPTQTQNVITKFCRQCPVRKDCLLASLSQPADQDFGIWGGTTEQERRTIRKIIAQS